MSVVGKRVAAAGEGRGEKAGPPGPAPQARESGRGDTRAAIARSATRLFAERGYDAVSMRDIAGLVGVRASALYNHFPAKQDILLDLMVRHMERLTAALDAELPTDAAPRERLAAFARFHVGYHLDEADAVFLSYMELRSLEPDNRRRVVALRDAYEGRLRAILADGRAEGDFALADPAVEAMALVAMLTGVTAWYRPGGRLSREAVIALHADLALRAVSRPEMTERTRR